MTVQDFLVERMNDHCKAFLKGLMDTPAEHFHLEPPAGGHAVAWHALHILDWNRILVSPGLNGNTHETFAHLGWENRDWAKAVHGPSLGSLSDSKEKIIGLLGQDFERGLADLKNATAERLEGKATGPAGERLVMQMACGQLRHIAYHWGQVTMVALQLAKNQV